MKPTMRTLFVLFVSACISGNAAHAAITTTGDSYTSGNERYIGDTGVGTMTVDGGSDVYNTYSYMGYNFGGDGTATITGSGSSWINTDDLCIGRYFWATLNIENGGLVTNRTGNVTTETSSKATINVTGNGSSWENSGTLHLGYWGDGVLNVDNGGAVSAYHTKIGYNSNSTGIATVDGTGSTLTSTDWTIVGTYGGSSAWLNIKNGGQVTNNDGYVGRYALSKGSVIVSGTDSQWTNSAELNVGTLGNGVLTIWSGGNVTTANGYISRYSGSYGRLNVLGTGAELTVTGNLDIGLEANTSGNLLVAFGGKVTADSISINNNTSSLGIHVTGNDLVVLGDASTTGSITNNGSVTLFAGSHAAPGVYTPISEFDDRAMTWAGSGTYKGIGGVWDDEAHTFTVSDARNVNAGDDELIDDYGRLIINHSGSGKKVGASFGKKTGNPVFSATPVDQLDWDTLAGLINPKDRVLDAWVFNTDMIEGEETLLQFDVDTDLDGYQVWHLDGGVWSLFNPKKMDYDAANGTASFTVSSFSGYAVTTPEPGTLLILTMGSFVLITRRKRK